MKRGCHNTFIVRETPRKGAPANSELFALSGWLASAGASPRFSQLLKNESETDREI